MKVARSLVAVLLLVGTAQAKDFCIDSGATGDSPDFIGENFRLPKKGKCKPFLGVAHINIYGRSVIDGVACTTSDGTRTTFMLAVARGAELSPPFSIIPGRVTLYAVRLGIPDLSGLVTIQNYDGTTISNNATGFECENDVIP